FRALDNHRLPRVDLRHLATPAQKFRLDVVKHFVVEKKSSPKRAGRDLARDVVFGGPESARYDDDARTLQSVAYRLFEPCVVVADDCLESDFDANRVEPVGQPEAVRVRAQR